MRSGYLEVLEEDYIRAARSRGVSYSTILRKHALRNVLIPVITVIGLQAGAILGGAVITETVFGLPGVGNLAITAIYMRDYPLVQTSVLVTAFLFVFINLFLDITYTLIDPRIRLLKQPS